MKRYAPVVFVLLAVVGSLDQIQAAPAPTNITSTELFDLEAIKNFVQSDRGQFSDLFPNLGILIGQWRMGLMTDDQFVIAVWDLLVDRVKNVNNLALFLVNIVLNRRAQQNSASFKDWNLNNDWFWTDGSKTYKFRGTFNDILLILQKALTEYGK